MHETASPNSAISQTIMLTAVIVPFLATVVAIVDRENRLNVLRDRRDVVDTDESRYRLTRSDSFTATDRAAPPAETVRAESAALSHERRTSTERAYFQGRASTVIAGQLGTTEGTAHQPMGSGLCMLRDRLSSRRADPSRPDSSSDSTPGTR